MTLVKIRQAKLKDAEAIFNIHRQAILNIKDYLYSNEIKQAWAPKNSKQAEQIITSEKYYTIVAELNDTVVGFGAVSDKEFELLFVSPDYQSQGIATQMLEHLESHAEHPITLKASKNSVEFYRKRGYKITSKFNTLVNNQVFDRFWASKD